MIGKLILEDGTEMSGISFGADTSIAGEVVFTTGMVGYPESFTDPSWYGQILVLTYPIAGSYGIPAMNTLESSRIQTSGVIVSNYIDTPSHYTSEKTLSQWLKEENVPGLEIKDTRALTKRLREKGTMLGKIIIDKEIDFYDPNVINVVADVSTKEVQTHGEGDKKIVLVDCGTKNNIRQCLLKRGVQVITVPWDYDIFSLGKIDGLVVSNGPGDPKMATKTIETIQKALQKQLPTLGICLGHQLLALAAGGNTSKMKYGHRGQNQPCIQEGTKRCYITIHNHGFAVDQIPKDFEAWFTNANDGANEGIKHKSLPFMSAQFHPEARPGPIDTEWIFGEFLKRV